MRSRHRNCSTPKEDFRDDLMKWQSITRERLTRADGRSESYDPK